MPYLEQTATQTMLSETRPTYSYTSHAIPSSGPHTEVRVRGFVVWFIGLRGVFFPSGDPVACWNVVYVLCRIRRGHVPTFFFSSFPAGYQTFTLYLYSPPIINQSRGSLLSSDPLSYRLSFFPPCQPASLVQYFTSTYLGAGMRKKSYVRTCVCTCVRALLRSPGNAINEKKVRRGESPGTANCVHPTNNSFYRLERVTQL